MTRLRAVSAVEAVVARDGDLVVERDPRCPSGRLLRQGEMDSSYVDLADPTRLEFDYMRWLRIVLRAARARRVVHVGGAACALARALAAEFPDGRQEVCELDSGVLELARAHMGLRRTPGLRVRHADGRAWVATQVDDGHDAIVVDAFIGARVPARLICVEALADAARVAPLVLVNVVDDRARREVDAVCAGLSAVTEEVWTLGARAGNTLCVGSRTSLPLARIAAAAAADPCPATFTDPHTVARRLAGMAARHDADA